MLAKVPEIIILDAIKKLLKYIRTDYATYQATPSKTMLYRIVESLGLQRYGLFDQAKAVFITQEEDPRHLDVNLFFNMKRAGIPTIHINLPSEQSRDNALGISEGFRPLGLGNEPDTWKRTFNRRFAAEYNIVISSDNTNEVVLIYHILRSMLISLFEHLNLSGLENITLSGRDLQINSDLVPPHIFMRTIGMNFSYDVGAVEIFESPVINELIFNQLAINDNL